MILIVTMFIFSLTMSFSPGPVNMIIISSAAAHGFRKPSRLSLVRQQDLLPCLYSFVSDSTLRLNSTRYFSNISTLLAQYLSCTWVIK